MALARSFELQTSSSVLRCSYARALRRAWESGRFVCVLCSQTSASFSEGFSFSFLPSSTYSINAETIFWENNANERYCARSCRSIGAIVISPEERSNAALFVFYSLSVKSWRASYATYRVLPYPYTSSSRLRENSGKVNRYFHMYMKINDCTKIDCGKIREIHRCLLTYLFRCVRSLTLIIA